MKNIFKVLVPRKKAVLVRSSTATRSPPLPVRRPPHVLDGVRHRHELRLRRHAPSPGGRFLPGVAAGEGFGSSTRQSSPGRDSGVYNFKKHGAAGNTYYFVTRSVRPRACPEDGPGDDQGTVPLALVVPFAASRRGFDRSIFERPEPVRPMQKTTLRISCLPGYNEERASRKPS